MIIPSSKYPAQTAIDANYPQGKARNVTASGDGTGTPLERDWINDLWGWMQALVLTTGVVPSGTPDNANSSQLLTAMRLLLLQKTIAVYDITPSVTESSGNPYPISLVYQFGGFSLSGNAVTVPAAGKYRVKFSGTMKSTSAVNPTALSASIALSGAAIRLGQTIRYSTSSLDEMLVSCEAIATVANPMTDSIAITSNSSTLQFTTLSGGPNAIMVIERLS